MKTYLAVFVVLAGFIALSVAYAQQVEEPKGGYAIGFGGTRTKCQAVRPHHSHVRDRPSGTESPLADRAAAYGFVAERASDAPSLDREIEYAFDTEEPMSARLPAAISSSWLVVSGWWLVVGSVRL